MLVGSNKERRKKEEEGKIIIQNGKIDNQVNFLPFKGKRNGRKKKEGEGEEWSSIALEKSSTTFSIGYYTHSPFPYPKNMYVRTNILLRKTQQYNRLNLLTEVRLVNTPIFAEIYSKFLLQTGAAKKEHSLS